MQKNLTVSFDDGRQVDLHEPLTGVATVSKLGGTTMEASARLETVINASVQQVKMMAGTAQRQAAKAASAAAEAAAHDAAIASQKLNVACVRASDVIASRMRGAIVGLKLFGLAGANKPTTAATEDEDGNELKLTIDVSVTAHAANGRLTAVIKVGGAYTGTALGVADQAIIDSVFKDPEYVAAAAQAAVSAAEAKRTSDLLAEAVEKVQQMGEFEATAKVGVARMAIGTMEGGAELLRLVDSTVAGVAQQYGLTAAPALPMAAIAAAAEPKPKGKVGRPAKTKAAE